MLNSFLFGLFGTCALQPLFPMLPLCFFAPFLLHLINTKSSLSLILWSSVAGFCADLIHSETPIGFFCAIFSVTALIWKKYDTRIHQDKPFSKALYAAIISLSQRLMYCSTLLLKDSYAISKSDIVYVLILFMAEVVFFLVAFFYPLYIIKKTIKKKYLILRQIKESLSSIRIWLKKKYEKAPPR